MLGFFFLFFCFLFVCFFNLCFCDLNKQIQGGSFECWKDQLSGSLGSSFNFAVNQPRDCGSVTLSLWASVSSSVKWGIRLDYSDCHVQI